MLLSMAHYLPFRERFARAFDTRTTDGNTRGNIDYQSGKTKPLMMLG